MEMTLLDMCPLQLIDDHEQKLGVKDIGLFFDEFRVDDPWRLTGQLVLPQMSECESETVSGPSICRD